MKKLLMIMALFLLLGCNAYMSKQSPYYFATLVIDKTKYKKVKDVDVYNYTRENLNYFLSEGYTVKAKSSFNTVLVDISWAELAAQQMGASVILYKNEYTGTSTGTNIIPWYVEGDTYTVTSNTKSNINVNGSGSSFSVGDNGYSIGRSSSQAYGTINSTTTTKIQAPGKYVFYKSSYSRDYYNQYALFLVKHNYHWIETDTQFYSEPDTDSHILRPLLPEERFIVLKKEKKFYKINRNGEIGYITTDVELK